MNMKIVLILLIIILIGERFLPVFWAGHPVVITEAFLGKEGKEKKEVKGYLQKYKIGFRKDGVVVWQMVKEESAEKKIVKRK